MHVRGGSDGLNGGDVDLLHWHHCLERALCLIATGRQRIDQHTRGDLPGETPAVLAPAALAFLAAIADDRVPVAICLFLIVCGDLEGKRLAVLELRAAVETETGNTQHRELDGQDITLLAARVVTGRLEYSGHFTLRKGRGVEARRLLRVLVVPEADRVLWLHARVLLVLDHDERRGLRSVIAMAQTVRLGCRPGLQSESDVLLDRFPSRCESGGRRS